MKPAAFRYHAPKTLNEAVAMLGALAPDDGRILAGGQSLVPIMAFRLARPAHLVDINGIAALGRLGAESGAVGVCGRVRHPSSTSTASPTSAGSGWKTACSQSAPACAIAPSMLPWSRGRSATS